MAYKRHRYLGYASCLALLGANVFVTYLISGMYFIGISTFTDMNYGKYLYFKPWIRIGAYQVGILYGILYYEWMNRTKNQKFSNSIGTIYFEVVKNSRVFRYLQYVVGLVLINVLIFVPHKETELIGTDRRYYSQFATNVYNAFSRPLFVGCLGMIIAGPLVGKNSFMRFILGSRGWAPWAKLTFMIYMLHLIVYEWFYAQIRQSIYLSYKPIFYAYAATLVFTGLLSIPLSATLEAPFMHMEKLLLFPEKPKAAKEKIEQLLENSAENSSASNEVMIKKLSSNLESTDSNKHSFTREETKMQFDPHNDTINATEK